jgi:hypothetical protein
MWYNIILFLKNRIHIPVLQLFSSCDVLNLQNVPHKMCQTSGWCYLCHFVLKNTAHILTYPWSWTITMLEAFKYLKILYHINFYEPPLRVLPTPANTTPIYLTFFWVHRPGLQCNQISSPLTTSWDGIWKTWSNGKVADENNPCGESRVCWPHKGRW